MTHLSAHLSAHRALASESRVRILHLLQQRAAALPVDEVADGVGLSVSTTREHLDRLVATGFVGSRPEVRTTRGRPRVLYRALPRAAAESRDPRARDQLLRVLAEGYGRVVERGEAEASGHRWGAELARAGRERPGEASAPRAGSGSGTARAAALAALSRAAGQLATLEELFEELGLEPEADVERRELHLHGCPVPGLVRARADVVCAVHLGVARGVLAHVDGPLEVDRLEPFVGAEHCVLHLTERGPVEPED